VIIHGFSILLLFPIIYELFHIGGLENIQILAQIFTQYYVTGFMLMPVYQKMPSLGEHREAAVFPKTDPARSERQPSLYPQRVGV
jgi:tellurite resistance protein TehA-like permease